jgi:hypothetical protein
MSSKICKTSKMFIPGEYFMKNSKRFVFLTIVLSVLLISVSCSLSKQKAGANDSSNENSSDSRSAGLYPALVSNVGDKKWGYIDDTGKFIIKPVFSSADDFQDNGLAVAGIDDKSGLIDKSGRYIVDPIYSYIDKFYEGRAIAQDSKGFRIIDEQGRVISSTEGFIGNFSDGRAVFYKTAADGKLLYGYFDTSGNVVIEPKYEYAHDFNDGRAIAKLVGDGF